VGPRAPWRIGIVSNVPRDLRPIFAAHGLADLIDAFTHSFEVGAEKPDPAIFLRATEALGTAPSETLMVGDHPVADAGALKAGLRFQAYLAAAFGIWLGLQHIVSKKLCWGHGARIP